MSIRKDVDYPGRWDAATTEYPMGKPKNRTTSTSKDGSYLEKKWIGDYEALLGAALGETGETPNGVQDTALDSQIYKAMQKGRQVLPFNLDWNGFMDPSHQSSLPSPSGYPGNSSGGEAVYSSGDEITLGVFSGSDLNSVSSDDDGWIFSGSIYKEYSLTTDQVSSIDVDSINVYIRGQDGSKHFASNQTNGVTVTKPSTSTIRVEIDSSIFSSLGITKLWRFFVSERLGQIVELSPSKSEAAIRGGRVRVSNSDFTMYIYPDGSFYASGIIGTGTTTPFSASIPIPININESVVTCTPRSSVPAGNGVTASLDNSNTLTIYKENTSLSLSIYTTISGNIL